MLKIFIIFSIILSNDEFIHQANGGGYTHKNNSPCVTDKRREEIKSTLRLNYSMLQERNLIDEFSFNDDRSVFLWPLRASEDYNGFSYYGISGFVDHNNNFPDQIQDYNCGSRSYDTMSGYNHSGTDIFTWPFTWNIMENDQVEVVASLDGIILGKDDGNYDQNCQNNDNLFWNAIYILHSNGTVGWYGHLKKYSLTEKNIGDSVSQGEFLGILGSSGNSSGPHLHFEVYGNTNQTILLDPYEGDCNTLNEQSWWIDQKPYYDSGINKLMTHSQVPDFNWNNCAELANIYEENFFRRNENIYIAAYFRDQLPGQITEWSLIDPSGSIHNQWNQTFYYFYYSSYWYYYFPIDNNFAFGEWKINISYLGESYEHSFAIFDNYGDVNFDGFVNVLDLVVAVGFIINENYNRILDMNFDDVLNVLDIVTLVDFIMVDE